MFSQAGIEYILNRWLDLAETDVNKETELVGRAPKNLDGVSKIFKAALKFPRRDRAPQGPHQVAEGGAPKILRGAKDRTMWTKNAHLQIQEALLKF